MKPLAVILIGVLALLYLLNPGAGVFELIPDNIPIIGNLDEAMAVYLILACLRYFGIDIADFFTRPDKNTNKENKELPKQK